MRMIKHVVGAALLSAALSAPVHAAIAVYTTEASFLAAISAPGVDTFDSLPAGVSTSPLARAAGTYTYTASTPFDFFRSGTAGDGWLSSGNPSFTITINGFSPSVQAIGGYFFPTNNLAPTVTPGDITASATDAGGTVTQIITNATPSSFLGFVSDGSLTSFTVKAVGRAGDGPFTTINNLTLGAGPAPALPEPATWMLLLLGFGAIGLGMRWRSTRSRRAGIA